MAIRIAYNAGHILATPGKRVPQELDPWQTREWVLNDRVARYFYQEMMEYEGVELLRLDDPEGLKPIDIDQRVAAANQWPADSYLSIHHNAAGRIFDGGGVEVYIDAEGGKSEEYAKAIYDAIVEATGLKGDRADPLRSTADGERLYETRATRMPAVLVEYGYMDSTVDAPIILTEAYARAAGTATARAIAKVAGLEKKEEEQMKKFNTIEEIPDYGKATVQKLVDAGALQGTGDGLNLSEDMLRILVILDRLGKL